MKLHLFILLSLVYSSLMAVGANRANQISCKEKLTTTNTTQGDPAPSKEGLKIIRDFEKENAVEGLHFETVRVNEGNGLISYAYLVPGSFDPARDEKRSIETAKDFVSRNLKFLGIDEEFEDRLVFEYDNLNGKVEVTSPPLTYPGYENSPEFSYTVKLDISEREGTVFEVYNYTIRLPFEFPQLATKANPDFDTHEEMFPELVKQTAGKIFTDTYFGMGKIDEVKESDIISKRLGLTHFLTRDRILYAGVFWIYHTELLAKDAQGESKNVDIAMNARTGKFVGYKENPLR